ncbi:fatty acid desaturase family protein [Alloalcanivorax xenomutans]|jgi:fatty acid desaturase|uniref:fatty acid desaturase family protein n=1 Tax=Alloalcanivorax xenomutans TaxID=1094342 RepID=UPI001E4490A7|nr:fatty acid desaturase family protein [Alloalcanivorax xenomutans]
MTRKYTSHYTTGLPNKKSGEHREKVMDHQAVYRHNHATRRKIHDIFTREEMAALTARSDAMGAWAIASTWAAIAGCFWVMAWAQRWEPWLQIPVLILATALLGGRQLALSILTHEATHKTLFQRRWANEGLTDWLCARPLGLNLAKYRAHHFIHHARTGTDEDADISLIEHLPTTRRSLMRKFLRDLTGLTGLKFLLGRALMDAERMKWTVATNVEWLPKRGFVWHLWAWLRNSLPTMISNLLLFAALYLCGYPQLFLGWVMAYLIPYPLFIRIRALAEHAGTERCADMFRNTRTTRAGWLARLFVAPFRVNYHLEHHAMASVPWFRLPAMHRMLRERQVVPAPPGYWRVLDIVSSAPA